MIGSRVDLPHALGKEAGRYRTHATNNSTSSTSSVVRFRSFCRMIGVIDTAGARACRTRMAAVSAMAAARRIGELLERV